jgi:hypothetical protein
MKLDMTCARFPKEQVLFGWYGPLLTEVAQGLAMGTTL